MAYTYKPPTYVGVSDSRDDIKNQFRLWNEMEAGAVTDFDLPFANNKTIEAEVVFILRGAKVTVRIDAWEDFATNLRCAALNIKDMRLMEARGSLASMRETLMALPAPGRDPWEIIGLDRRVPLETARLEVKLLLRKYHPDNRETGDAGRFKEIQAAWEEIQRG